MDGYNTKTEDDVFYSAPSSLLGFLVDSQSNLLAEFEAVKEVR